MNNRCEHSTRSDESLANGSDGSAPAMYRSGEASRSVSMRSAAVRRIASCPTTPPRTSQSKSTSRACFCATERSTSARIRPRRSSAPRAYWGSTAIASPPAAQISATALAAPPGQSTIRPSRSAPFKPNMSVYSANDRALTRTSVSSSAWNVVSGLTVTWKLS